MIYSMTAFARKQTQGDWGSASCDMRSVNHRYLDVSLRLPEALRDLEQPIRERFREKIQRGKIECNIRYTPGEQTPLQLSLNKSLAHQLIQLTQEIQKIAVQATAPSATELMKWPGMIISEETDNSSIYNTILRLVDDTIEDFVAARHREGLALKQLMLEKLKKMQLEINSLQPEIPGILQQQRERLLERLKEAKQELDPNRLEQEMVLVAQKIDVTEEIDRLQAHFKELRRLLEQGGDAGKRLDFLLQECNREANTLASKSNYLKQTQAAIELKVLIEQIREQVQNIQ